MYRCVLTSVFPLVIARLVRTIVSNVIGLYMREHSGACQERSPTLATHSSSLLGLLSV